MKSFFKFSALFTLAAALLAPALHAVPGVPGPAPKEAWLIPVKDNWEITPSKPGGPADLAENLMLIALQGLANTDAPRVYIEYPPTWHFHDFNPLKDFYASKYGVKFTPTFVVNGKTLDIYAWDDLQKVLAPAKST